MNPKVIILPEVTDKLNELIEILFKEGYFGFKDSAVKYVISIHSFIQSIPQQKRKPTINDRLGSFYCKYKANQHTTWYICFDVKNETYLVKNIFNNHSWEYPYFIQND